MIKYTPECNKLQHLIFFSWGSMLAHSGLEVKGSNPLLAFGQQVGVTVWDIVKSIINFSNFHGICTFSKKKC